MKCSLFSYTTTDENGVTFDVYEQTTTPVSDCAQTNLAEQIVLTGYEYQELSVMAGQVTTLDQAVAAMDPAEVSAVYGASFALTVFLAAIAYKVKVGKRLVKLI